MNCEEPIPRRPSPLTSNILEEAHKVIYGDREQTYGEPSVNLRRIAELWSTYLGIDILGSSNGLTPSDVCNMMILLKVARLKNQPEHRDSQVDICGYAALMERIQKEEE